MLLEHLLLLLYLVLLLRQFHEMQEQMQQQHLCEISFLFGFIGVWLSFDGG